MKLLKGKTISKKILSQLKLNIRKEKIKPGLAVVLVGSDKASKIYVSLKKKAAEKVGINFYLYNFSEKDRETEIIQKIKKLNNNPKINGTIVQLPLPKKYQTQKILKAIDCKKDVDGFLQKSFSQPVFPKAIVNLLESSKQKLSGKKAIVISNSKIFGKTMVIMIERQKIKSEYIVAKNKTLQHSRVLKQIKNADILITAVGKPGLINGNMIKKGAIIIDGGITKVGKKVLGDVDAGSVKNKASYLSPVPGGVGPVTIACLLENVYLATKKSR